MKFLFLAASTACVICSSAMASTGLSGNYAVQYSQTCQIVVDVDKTTGAVSIDKYSTGATIAASPGVIAFDQADGTYAWNGEINGVSLVLEKFSDGSKKGSEGGSYAFAENEIYSNTDNTLTLDGSVYDVVYSGIDENGIAHGFMATLHLPLKHTAANHCVVSLQGQMQ
ncbi:MAG TPA: hypothetical protein VHY79_12710 [Rhizomicrobium sp.]|jgi:hypothetical protein|nr:hypothetical protein [Rhizomicrobium sp.]